VSAAGPDDQLRDAAAQLAARDARIAELEATVAMQKALVEELSEKLRRNSSNSHLPPGAALLATRAAGAALLATRAAAFAPWPCPAVACSRPVADRPARQNRRNSPVSVGNRGRDDRIPRTFAVLGDP